MSQASIDQLIINSPYEEPKKFWKYERESRSFQLLDGRRPAGYLIASADSKSFDDPGHFIEIPLVNQIRKRVKNWREAGYSGVSSITKRLLAHWNNPEDFELRRFFFCQLEAIETLIWLAEAPPNEKVGLDILGDGGDFVRQCCKMATGSGKTFVMAMVIAWHILNKTSYPKDPRFSKNILIIAPGLTVKNRLSVLKPAAKGNYYEEYSIVSRDFLEKLRQGKVLVRNWHALSWENEEKIKKQRSIDKRGVKSDEAYTRGVLGEMARARKLLVINDEAHHAWRVNQEAAANYKSNNELKESNERATVWISGLDRIHRSRNILMCYDFSATPYIPFGREIKENMLFEWIVSDFGLNDSIESGLVKTPRVVIRDDTLLNPKNYKSRLYHIYNDHEVKNDLNRSAEPHTPLPDLIANAYYLLGYDWRETLKSWEKKKNSTPPVMITICNRTETAARIKYAFDLKKIDIDELCNQERILHIDSKVLKEAEDREEFIGITENIKHGGESEEETALGKGTKSQKAELLRQIVDTVGKKNELGEKIQNVISVGMLSEGWDAKTVTHIMGLRSFTSQLLCEQVIGRGLRRTSYEVNADTGLFDPEYVNIFGVPFTFLPHEGSDNGPPPPLPSKTAVHPHPEREEFEIRWPNIVSINRIFQNRLSLDLSKIQTLEINAAETLQLAELAQIIDGKADISKIERIDLEKLPQFEKRYQRIVFETAANVFDEMKYNWKGSRELLLAQLATLTEEFIKSKKLKISPPLFYKDELRRRLILTLNMQKLIKHVCNAVTQENTEALVPVFDSSRTIRSTGEMRTWFTIKPCEITRKSHINFCVYDSTWEASDAFTLENTNEVTAWVKNDHLGFEIFYVYDGIVRKYRPDFLIRFANGGMMVLETKGQNTDLDKAKFRNLEEWVTAVNTDGRFGKWQCAAAKKPGEIRDILALVRHKAK